MDGVSIFIIGCFEINESKIYIIIALIIFRMDKDQFMRKQAYAMAGYKNMQEIEYYEFEGNTISWN